MTSRRVATITRVMQDDQITERLRQLGEHSVPSDVRDTHLHRMSAVSHTPVRQKRFGRVAVAAAAMVGFFAGSTGLAMAGALPAPAQGVAHDVLSVVQVDVPDRPNNRGKCISEAAKSFDDDPANEAAKKEAIEQCKTDNPPGRPEGVGRGEGVGRPAHAGQGGERPHADDECKGPPPWAGKPGEELTPAQEEARDQAFENQRAQNCPAETDDQEATESGG